ncbi:Protein of unknown function [Pyronema omphalodes CBS 100304]|uniref:Uncharacterized protein n=1 Tax=Pyronema omphalodes (strain CBS 100304) TaxID=1076935 RepID=U4LYH0_PYROM|nr:Protein of unknown function [Pyronema omphalodes CBS 100304]
MIRFVAGMEPGSAHHKRMVERATNGDHTHVTFGDGNINYGNIGASGFGAIHHLYDACHEETNFGWHKLNLHPQGQYNGWDERNIFVEAMVAAAGQEEKCEDKSWANGGGYGNWAHYEHGTERQCRQTNFISINRFSWEGYLMGFMSVLVELENPSNGWCAQTAGVMGAIAGAVGAAPSMAVGSALGAGLFGLISAFCS